MLFSSDVALRTAIRAMVLLTVLTVAIPAADVPGIIAYQGRIAVSGGPFNGTGQFKFALVNATGTTTYWSNDGSGVGGAEPAAAVLIGVQGGLFTVLLGDTGLPNMTVVPATVFQNNDVALRIWFKSGAPGSVFELLSPDRRIAVAGYAMLAQDSNQLGGQPAASYRDASNLNAGTVPVARLPVATPSAVGAVRPDGTTITVDANGALTAAAGIGSPTGAAGGDLAGTYPNPSIASGAVTSAKVSSGSATSGQVLTATGTGSASWQTPVGAVSSVAGRTGAVTLTPGDVGLGNVDNTSDANKPVSTAQAAALAAHAALTSTHGVSAMP